jgi:hypothetical protein
MLCGDVDICKKKGSIGGQDLSTGHYLDKWRGGTNKTDKTNGLIDSLGLRKPIKVAKSENGEEKE